MRRGDDFSLENGVSEGLSEISYLVKMLGKHVEKFELAYKRKDYKEFNILKKHILEIQKRIKSLL